MGYWMIISLEQSPKQTRRCWGSVVVEGEGKDIVTIFVYFLELEAQQRDLELSYYSNPENPKMNQPHFTF